MMQDVTYAFENYVKTCIRYFKIIDESDIIQQDYNGSPIKHQATLECVEESNNELDELEEELEDEENDESDELDEDDESEQQDDESEDELDDESDEDEEVSEHCIGTKEEPYEPAPAHKSRYFNEDALCAIISEDEEDSDEVKEPKTEVKEVKKEKNEKKALNNQANVLAPIALKGRLDIFMRGGKQEQAPRNKPVKDIVPKVKDINLENPELKNKGIGKEWKEKNW
jgi:hypothetical protein